MIPNLLEIPFRVCDPMDLENALGEIISRDFYQPAAAFDDLHRAQQLHMLLVSGAKDADVDLERYNDTLKEYYYLIKDIEAKFPDHAVTFEWFDTFSHRPSVLQVRTWCHEKQFVVFQAGILYSRQAQKLNAHTDDGIKKACAYFQAAAGCFQSLIDEKTDAPGLDSSTLQCMRSLMVSAAQELIWQKATRNTTMKDSIIARLLVQVADFYADAAKHASTSPSVRQDWINHMQVKTFHFRAAANYRMAMSALDNFEYGVQVGYLKTAAQLCTEAAKYKRYVSEFVLEDLAGLRGIVETCMLSAEKDNDLVYLKPVPSPKELPAIVGVSMVNPKTPEFLVDRDSKFKAAFAKLMPFAVVQVSQAFRERQEAYIASAFHEPIKALNHMLRQFLTERQLPASLDSMEVPEGLPDSIILHSQEIMAIGGVRIIESSMDAISDLAANSRALVSECEERLRLEHQEDDLMRQREGTSLWTRMPSHEASAPHWVTVDKMREYLSQGQQSDSLLGNIYKSIRVTLDAYCGGKKTLLACIPRNAHVSFDEDTENAVATLRQLLSEVSRLESKRENFESSIDLKSRSHSILSVVIDSYKQGPEKFQNGDGSIDQIKFEHIYEKHISLFNTDLEYLTKLKEQQVALERQIDEANKNFDRVKSTALTKAHSARLTVLQRLESDYVKYLELVKNLNQASKFYTSFLERGNSVLQELDEYLLRRREEARELALTIQEQRNFEGIEQSMMRNRSNLASPRAQKANTWDPSKGIRFS